MAIHEFTIQALKELDGGRVAEAFAQALRRCVQDCDDRPGVKKTRAVVLKMMMQPIASDDGTLDEIKTQFQVVDTAPKRESKVYSMAFRRGGMLAFNDLSPTDVKTRTFDELDGAAGESFRE